MPIILTPALRQSKMLNSITVIVKTSNSCNIKCSYCYVNHCTSSSSISINNLPKLIENCCKGFSLVQFVWLGGEPLLMGLPYYEAANEIQNYYRKKGTTIHNSLQTNGTLLNDDFLSFFKKNHFGVGISFDAPYETQIQTRTTLFSENEWFSLFKKIKNYGMQLSFLCVVTENNLHKANEILKFFEKANANHFSLHPEIIFKNLNDSEQLNNSLFELFKTVFDLWMQQKSNIISTIDPLSTMISNLNGNVRLCTFSSKCAKGLISINPNGIVIPCSSLDISEYYFDTILKDKSLIEILQSQSVQNFRNNLIKTINENCKDCKYVSICRNGCKSISYWASQTRYPLCTAYKKTYDYLLNQIKTSSDPRQ